MTAGSLARNVLSNWIVLAASVVYTLVMTPLIVSTMGVERYGVWSFLNGLLAYSELLYLGLGSALVKYVAQFRAKGDIAGINRLASVVTSIYAAIGLGCFLLFWLVSGFVPLMFAEPLSPAVARAASITCVLLGVRLLTIFSGSAFAGLLSGHERYDLVNGVQLVGFVLRFILTPVLLSLDYDPLLSMAWLTAGSVAFDLVAFAVVAFHHVRGLVVRPVVPRWPELRWLYGFGLQSFFILFAVKLISYTDTTVIGFTLGAGSVAVYSLPLQLVEYSRMCVGGFAGVFLPKVAFQSAHGDHAGMRESYLRSARISAFLAGWLGALLIGLGPAFLDQWVGHGFGAPAFWVLVFLSLALFGQVLSSQVPLAFYQALDLLAVPALVLMLEAALNFALSITLAPRYGLVGVAVATAIPALISLAILPRYLCTRLGVSMLALARNSVLPGVLMFLSTLALQYVLSLAISTSSWAALVARGIATVPLAAALIYFTFPADEQQAVRVLLRSVFLRLRKPDTAAETP